MVAGPDVSGRVSNCREELEQCRPDRLIEALQQQARRVSSSDGSARVPSFEKCREGLRAEKFRFIQLQEQSLFAAHSLEQWGSDLANLTASRKEHKDDIKALKQSISQEERLQGQLLEELERVYRHNVMLFERAEQELQHACADTDREDPADYPMTAHACGQVSEQASNAMLDNVRLHTQVESRRTEARHLQAELQRLQEQMQDDKRKATQFRRLEAQETKLTRGYEELFLGGERLGLPKYTYDKTRKVFIVGPPAVCTFESLNAVRDIDERVRMVEVDWDEAGRLCRAETHPMLKLQDEAALALEEDDLGRLLAAVWGKLCASAGAGPQAPASNANARCVKPKRGGA